VPVKGPDSSWASGTLCFPSAAEIAVTVPKSSGGGVGDDGGGISGGWRREEVGSPAERRGRIAGGRKLNGGGR
jgi:hypothetical protein